MIATTKTTNETKAIELKPIDYAKFDKKAFDKRVKALREKHGVADLVTPFAGKVAVNDEGYLFVVVKFVPRKKYCLECVDELGNRFGLTEMGLMQYMM